MYAKIFTQIFDSSIADNWKTRHVFEDLLKLADPNGVVDMTQNAIAARTRLPIEMVRDAIKELESPDPNSRSQEADGRRIERLDEHRDWGWHIINYHKFREIASEEQRRAKTRARVANFKAKRSITHGNAVLTPANAGNAMQKQMEMDKEMNIKEVPPTPVGFDEFWKAYPRKVGKADALRAWKRAKCSGIVPKILEAVTKQKETSGWKNEGGRYIPHPSTWLNQGRWDDETTPEPEHRYF